MNDFLTLYRDMLLIRRFEEKSAEMYALAKIAGFLHLYIGQEAVAVGCMHAIRPDDYVITSYRDHGHCLARGSDPKKVMAELFGKATGLCKGKGGSMHLIDVERNFMGGYAIVGGHVPLATGLAFASRYRKEDRVVLCFLAMGRFPADIPMKPSILLRYGTCRLFLFAKTTGTGWVRPLNAGCCCIKTLPNGPGRMG